MQGNTVFQMTVGEMKDLISRHADDENISFSSNYMSAFLQCRVGSDEWKHVRRIEEGLVSAGAVAQWSDYASAEQPKEPLAHGVPILP